MALRGSPAGPDASLVRSVSHDLRYKPFKTTTGSASQKSFRPSWFVGDAGLTRPMSRPVVLSGKPRLARLAASVPRNASASDQRDPALRSFPECRLPGCESAASSDPAMPFDFNGLSCRWASKPRAVSHHGSSSCGQDRLGHSEQPTKAQCRASHSGSADIRSYELPCILTNASSATDRTISHSPPSKDRGSPQFHPE